MATVSPDDFAAHSVRDLSRELIRSRDERQALALTEALAQRADEAVEALPLLVKRAEQSRAGAARALHAVIASGAPELWSHVGMLRRELASPDAPDRAVAARALRQLAVTPRAGLPSLHQTEVQRLIDELVREFANNRRSHDRLPELNQIQAVVRDRLRLEPLRRRAPAQRAYKRERAEQQRAERERQRGAANEEPGLELEPVDSEPPSSSAPVIEHRASHARQLARRADSRAAPAAPATEHRASHARQLARRADRRADPIRRAMNTTAHDGPVRRAMLSVERELPPSDHALLAPHRALAAVGGLDAPPTPDLVASGAAPPASRPLPGISHLTAAISGVIPSSRPFEMPAAQTARLIGATIGLSIGDHRLQLPAPVRDALSTIGVAQLGQLASLDEEDLLGLPGVDEALLLATKRTLARCGLRLGLTAQSQLQRAHRPFHLRALPEVNHRLPDDVLRRPVGTLDLPAHLRQALSKARITLIGDLVSQDLTRLAKLEGLDQEAALDIEDRLDDLGLELGKPPRRWTEGPQSSKPDRAAYLTLEQAMRALSIEADRFKQLVRDNRIRAYKNQDAQVVIRERDIASLRRRLASDDDEELREIDEVRLDLESAAEHLGLRPAEVRRLVLDGALKANRDDGHWTFLPSQLEAVDYTAIPPAEPIAEPEPLDPLLSREELLELLPPIPGEPDEPPAKPARARRQPASQAPSARIAQLSQTAEAALRHGELSRAISILKDQVLPAAPDFAEARQRLHECVRRHHKELGRVRRAPSALLTKSKLALLMARGKYDAAIAACENILLSKPGDVATLYKLGQAAYAAGYTQSAIAALEEVLGAQPEHALSWRLLAKIYEDRGELDKALECLAKATRLDPSDAESARKLKEISARQTSGVYGSARSRDMRVVGERFEDEVRAHLSPDELAQLKRASSKGQGQLRPVDEKRGGVMQHYSFDRVLKELDMSEDELKRLLSEGEIRAFSGQAGFEGVVMAGGSADDDEILLVEDDASETLLDIDELSDEALDGYGDPETIGGQEPVVFLDAETGRQAVASASAPGRDDLAGRAVRAERSVTLSVSAKPQTRGGEAPIVPLGAPSAGKARSTRRASGGGGGERARRASAPAKAKKVDYSKDLAPAPAAPAPRAMPARRVTPMRTSERELAARAELPSAEELAKEAPSLSRKRRMEQQAARLLARRSELGGGPGERQAGHAGAVIGGKRDDRAEIELELMPAREWSDASQLSATFGASGLGASVLADVRKLMEQGRWDEAVSEAEQLLAADPRDPQRIVLEGDAKLGRIQAQLEEAQARVRAGDKRALSAVQILRDQHLGARLHHYLARVAALPDNPLHRLRLGEAQVEAERHAFAVQNLVHAVGHPEYRQKASRLLGEAYLAQDQQELAAGALRAAVEDSAPDDASMLATRLQLARVLEQTDPRDARELFAEIVAHFPGHDEAVSKLAELERRLPPRQLPLDRKPKAAPELPVRERSASERALSREAGRPGPLERLVAGSRELTELVWFTFGQRFVPAAHAADVALQAITGYLGGIVRALKHAQMQSRAQARRGKEVESLLDDLASVRFQAGRLFALASFRATSDPLRDDAYTRNRDSEATQPLALILDLRHRLDKLDRDLSTLTAKARREEAERTVGGLLGAFFPNVGGMLRSFGELLHLLRLDHTRCEIEEIVIDIVLAVRQALRLLQVGDDPTQGPPASRLWPLTPAEQVLVDRMRLEGEAGELGELDRWIQIARDRIVRLIQALVNPGRSIDPRRWPVAEWIIELSKDDPHPLPRVLLEGWLREQIGAIYAAENVEQEPRDQNRIASEGRDHKRRLELALSLHQQGF